MDTEQDLDVVAAVDLGSNSFHMVVARVRRGELIFVDRQKEMVRLAGGLGPDKRLSDDVIDRALACLRRFGERLASAPRDCVRVVGTNTLRNARNTHDFLTRAEDAIGHPIDIVSGIEEARLIYVGVAATLAPDQQRLVIDIGGGSTELIIGRGSHPQAMESLYMGCVSMSDAFFTGGELSKKCWRRAEVAAGQELESVMSRFQEIGWREVVGSSGTVRSVLEVVTAHGWADSVITRQALGQLRDAMLAAGSVDRLELNGLSDDRRPVFAGGVAILGAIFDALSIDEMNVSAGALREGLLYDLLGRLRHDDARERAVQALAERYHADPAQSAAVERTALALYDQVREGWRLRRSWSRQLLSWAAQLHEIGLDIAHSHYHRHGAYIIENADLFGFSRLEQRLIATLVRLHRRRFSPDLFSHLLGDRRRVAEHLAVLLRLAVLLHRSRNPEARVPIEAAVAEGVLRLTVPAGALDRAPLSRADLVGETELLRAAGVAIELCELDAVETS